MEGVGGGKGRGREDEDEDIRGGLESLFLVGRRCTMTCVGEIGVVMVRVVVVEEVLVAAELVVVVRSG